jgi:phosphohistidine phosphatase
MGSKTLFLLRHAKSQAAGISVEDLDRPLSDKGVKDTNKLANKLFKKNLDFDLVITSPAVRAITTAQILLNCLDIPRTHLVVNDSLYGSEPMILLKVISSISKKIDNVMIVGHNPSLMGLASFLVGEPIYLSTCSLVKLSFEFKDWHDIFSKRTSKFSLLN